jgi:hypothetical protein
MATYTYLFAPKTKQAICLYKKIPSRTPPYQGVIVYLPQRYWLPSKYLELLIDRFSKAHDGDIIYIEDDALWELIGEEDHTIDIGGDCEWDLPHTKYLPELDNPAVQQEIKSHHELKIG